MAGSAVHAQTLPMRVLCPKHEPRTDGDACDGDALQHLTPNCLVVFWEGLQVELNSSSPFGRQEFLSQLLKESLMLKIRNLTPDITLRAVGSKARLWGGLHSANGI